MTLSRLPKNKDITFIDPKTMESMCRYNECYKKFAQKSKYKINMLNGDQPIKFKTYFHECIDCGMVHKNKEDRGLSVKNYESAIIGKDTPPELTEKEKKYVDDFLQKKSKYARYMNGSPRPTFKKFK